jgi:tRNA-specific 2-thiouridylase
VRIDPGRNALTVGDAASVECPELVAGEVNWIAIPRLEGPRPAAVRIRHAAADVPAVIAPAPEDRVAVRFDAPPRAAAPGQAVAFYDGEVVLGGGVIEDVGMRSQGPELGWAVAGAAQGSTGVAPGVRR